MSLSIEIRTLDCAVVLELSGRVSILEEHDLRRVAWDLIEQGERNFVINLANVSYLDNSGLGQLCWIYTVLRNRGGEMRLLKPTPRIKRLLTITRLDTVFICFDRETDAIESMNVLAETVSA
jgi:anti-sigma B factor antagonist